MPQVITSIQNMQRIADGVRIAGRRIAVVPTMGYLHEGHLSLISLARQHAEAVITTIFVNPLQFGPSEDFARYPRDLDRDVALASSAGTHYVFAPSATEMYPDPFQTAIHLDRFESMLEGSSRPGHFRGVTTVVAKLFHITRPHTAIFGQKDAQQAVVIGKMIEDLNFDIELIVAPTVREPDGLAMSSRNVYLTPAQRAEAPVLYQSLVQAEQRITQGENSCSTLVADMKNGITSASSGVIDYVSIAHGRTLEELQSCHGVRPLLISLAVRFGNTRLIDNIVID